MASIVNTSGSKGIGELKDEVLTKRLSDTEALASINEQLIEIVQHLRKLTDEDFSR